jgi:predicted MFS family arabinose efflux permease
VNDRTAVSHPLTAGLIRLLAISAGLTVANIYYNQSLLHLISQHFGVSESAVSTMAFTTQLGYATGLLLLVPLGDILNRKRLIVGTAVGAGLSMLVIAWAPNLTLMVIASYIMGTICITPQIIVPYAVSLAEPERRGKIVGMVMAGLLVGILASRSASGFLGEWIGWREVFVVGATVTLLNALALHFFLPPPPKPEGKLSYHRLLFSLLPLLWEEPVLRRHSLLGFLSFGAFSAFWTSLSFYLANRPEHYGSQVVGLFALIAVAGAVAAPIAGHFSDKINAKVVNGLALTTMMLGFAAMGLADYSLIFLGIGIFLMDAGAQANQISNQTRIYSLAPALRSRITSVYMVMYFLGGASGSIIGAHAWEWWHWTGVWGTGIVMSLLALACLFIRNTRHQSQH